jgi:hypothetical protein
MILYYRLMTKVDWFRRKYGIFLGKLSHERVDLPDGTYTLTQEEEGASSGEVNQLGV